MRRFAALYDALDSTNSTNVKVAAMQAYFAAAPPRDAAWALFFLTGRRLKRLIAPRLLAQWGCEAAGVPGWLFDECIGLAGDLAETIALLLDTARQGRVPVGEDLTLSRLIADRLLPLRDSAEGEKREAVLALWEALDRREVFLLDKLLTGELRVGVSDTLAIRALAQHAGLPPATVAHRLMGAWEPTAAAFSALIASEGSSADISRPYPFFLATQLDEEPEALGDRADWLVEWKWDGIRAQIVRRGGGAFLWSRGEELITDRFPDLSGVWAALPEGTVLDGEVLAFEKGAPLPFSVLQRRIGRQKLGPAILAEAPAAFMAYDVLEQEGRDVRQLPLHERRARLAGLAQDRSERLSLSPEVDARTWAELRELRSQARERGVEGLMLKRRDSPYRHGRPRGEWWKWKIDPYSIDAVLVYAQPGHGRRATLMTDLTFALWDGDELVPVAKAYSGLTDEEIDRLDRWIRQHTRERFGPVRAVDPVHVFELHFEGIGESTRHRSGVAVRFPRISRWRTDKTPADADTLQTLRSLIKARK
ncbi:MAG TPA: ATP-dependent DNA ligase [Myxococcales bacterium]|jgi:DNA ligase-1|nr:ATP-dependent DNA ligase [Myxococcales bacterium]